MDLDYNLLHLSLQICLEDRHLHMKMQRNLSFHLVPPTTIQEEVLKDLPHHESSLCKTSMLYVLNLNLRNLSVPPQLWLSHHSHLPRNGQITPYNPPQRLKR